MVTSQVRDVDHILRERHDVANIGGLEFSYRLLIAQRCRGYVTEAPINGINGQQTGHGIAVILRLFNKESSAVSTVAVTTNDNDVVWTGFCDGIEPCLCHVVLRIIGRRTILRATGRAKPTFVVSLGRMIERKDLSDQAAPEERIQLQLAGKVHHARKVI